MTTSSRALVHGIVALVASVATATTAAHAEPVNPRNYPALGDQEIGQIRHLVKMGYMEIGRASCRERV